MSLDTALAPLPLLLLLEVVVVEPTIAAPVELEAVDPAAVTVVSVVEATDPAFAVEPVLLLTVAVVLVLVVLLFVVLPLLHSVLSSVNTWASVAPDATVHVGSVAPDAAVSKSVHSHNLAIWSSVGAAVAVRKE